MNNFFTDIILQDPRMESTERISDLSTLEPVTRKLVQNIIKDAAAHGMELMVFETFRSKNRQKMLFDQGSTQLLNVGVHHYGLACDIVKKVNGEPSWKGDFSLLGQLAKNYGLIWGGNWGTPEIHHSFIDVYHVQRCTIASQASLFSGEWYPGDNYNPYDELK
jgi:hypothetical protein